MATKLPIAVQGPAHAKYGASSSERWGNCSGSIALSMVSPKPRDSPYALEGTEAHSCLEFLLNNRNRFDAALRQARKKYSQEMIGHCVTAYDEIMAIYARYPNADFLCETRIDSSAFTCDGQFGTVDCAIVAEFDHLTVIDFKYGAGIAVDPSGHDGEGNSQLVYYGLGISHKYHHNFATASLVVIQPRAYHESGDTTREFHIDMDDLIAWGLRFKAAVARTIEKPEEYTPGDWCRFCPAKVICPAIAKPASGIASKKDVASSHEEIPLKDLPGLLDLADKAEKWIGAIREYALDRMIQGDLIDGYRLADKRGRRAWNADADIENDLTDKLGRKAWVPPQIKSPAEIEKITVKGFSKKEWSDYVDIRTETKSSGVTMKKDKPMKVSGIFSNVIDVTAIREGKK